MPYFNRFDICAAHRLIEVDYNMSGWLQERPSNWRRREATHIQLARLKYRPSLSEETFAGLEENAKDIYCELVDRYGFELEGEAYRHVHGEDKPCDHYGTRGGVCEECGDEL